MNTYIYVGLGGALGAMLRYALSTVTVRTDFPFMTLLTNLTGAFLIGCIVGIAESHENIPSGLILFLKTGFCGGYTTFSTFSLETFTLFEQKNYSTGIVYAVLSLLLCLIGVWAGRTLCARN